MITLFRKPLLAFFAALVLVNTGYAQIQNPVKWTSSVEQKSSTEATLIMSATIEKDWHVYSQFIDDGGPIPTSIKFEKTKNYALDGKAAEAGKMITEFDKSFEMNLKFFTDRVTFRQAIKIKNEKKFTVKASLDFMVCNSEMCLPPDTKDFEFVINPDASGSIENEKESKENKSAAGITATDSTALAAAADSASNTADTAKAALVDGLEPGCGEGEVAKSDLSLLGIFLGGILGGLLALITPCVFPMIPLTVSFFTKRSGTKRKGIINALIYAASILIIYVTLGLLITVTLGSDALNEMASSVFFNLLFFGIFLVFSLSFFGAFELTMPSALINKADSASERGGLLGIFFMAFTLSLVSFSCTGPIIGTLLVEAAHGGNFQGPLLGMTGFALALAFPFALFAAFPGWLNSLPKSGGWLNSVKVCLGFVELALSLKFFSNVDLAYHWGFLKRELFISIWVVIFALMGIYLLGKIRFSHDSESKHVSTPRLIFALLSLTFSIYLIPGLWGAPLKLVSGIIPPGFYKEWSTPGSKNEHCPQDLACFHDYDEGMAYAKLQGKPVMVDFTGWSCVNCRKMEDNVWSDTKVLQHLKEDYVLISLYVDDKTELPVEKQSVSTFSGKKLKTTGNVWSDMQAARYGVNSQPYYVLLDTDEKPLAKPRGYTPDIDAYNKYLEEGLCRYKKRKKQ